MDKTDETSGSVTQILAKEELKLYQNADYKLSGLTFVLTYLLDPFGNARDTTAVCLIKMLPEICRKQEVKILGLKQTKKLG